jgi:protocatechuate 3,4-dioxygenase beta subunit
MTDRGRRRALALLGAAGAGLLARPARAQAPDCVVTPAQTEGPFFVDERLHRSDIRSDPRDGSLRPGVPLALALRASTLAAAGCAPLAGAMIDLWHCDAGGAYSGTAEAGAASRFLRGYQITDARGETRFTTLYPGWYPGRAVHLHVKVRAALPDGRRIEFASQIYFDDAVTDRVAARQPYAARDPRRRVRNEADILYRRGGPTLLAALREADAGYAAAFAIGLRL